MTRRALFSGVGLLFTTPKPALPEVKSNNHIALLDGIKDTRLIWLFHKKGKWFGNSVSTGDEKGIHLSHSIQAVTSDMYNTLQPFIE